MRKKLKRSAALMSAVAMLMTMLLYLPSGIFSEIGLGLTASAAEITLTQPAGDGSSGNPYRIGTKEELYWFADKVNRENDTYGSANAVLTKDITVNTGVLESNGYSVVSDTSGFTTWTPIGKQSAIYKGTFDGQGHIVSGLYYNASVKNIGLFGFSNGTIMNVGVVDSYFKGYCYIGGVCGNNGGTIQRSYSKSCVKGSNYLGGLCGYNLGTIEDCYCRGHVDGYSNMGGLTYYNKGTILRSYCQVSFSSTLSHFGGLCAYNDKTIKNCYYDKGRFPGNPTYQGSVENSEGKSAAELRSGEVAYLLQSAQEADADGNIPEVWGQTLGTDDVPVLGGEKVYTASNCTGYSNTENDTRDHNNAGELGRCLWCGEYESAVLTTNKYDLDGDGSKDNVYEISNANQLYWLANKSRKENDTYGTAYYVLTADIVVNPNLLSSLDADGNEKNGNDLIAWEGISGFDGIFDGQNHTISGLYFNTSSNGTGLFLRTGWESRILNVGVVDSYFNGGHHVSAVCADNYGLIENCYSKSKVSGEYIVGGICGSTNFNGETGNLVDCYNAGEVIGKPQTGSNGGRIGGVCGSVTSNSSVTAAAMECCYNTGTVTSKTGSVGGVCGTNSTAIVENCYNTGTVIGSENLSTGGVCGINYTGTIRNCFSIGKISKIKLSTDDNKTDDTKLLAGEVCGTNSYGTVENCSYDSSVNSNSYKAVADSYFSDDSGFVNTTETVNNANKPHSTTQFGNGEYAYTLQNLEGGSVWGQELGKDTHPVLHGPKVYYVKSYSGCKGKPGASTNGYSNTNSAIYKKHNYIGGVCEYCGGSPQVTLTKDKYDINGDGKYDEVFEISNASELYWFAGLVNGTLSDVSQISSANAVLTKDIDLSGKGDWTPIGNNDNKYTGTFDGQGHTIKNMSITKQGNNSGLFGYISNAAIKNTIITGKITITAESYTEGYGSIAGRMDNSTITNCHSSVNITVDSTMASSAGNCIGHIGGIVGKMHEAKSAVSNCSYSGTIELNDKPVNVAAGIVGYATYNSVPITNCSFTGKINSTYTGAILIGGIFGYTRNSGDVKITNCLSAGTITKSGDTSLTGILIGQINTGYGKNAVKNNYCISSSLNVFGSKTGNPTTEPATICTETQLASGEVAYLLQSTQTEAVWGQKIGTDPNPVLGGEKVYLVKSYAGCKDAPGESTNGYSNTDASIYKLHNYVDNYCEYCGVRSPIILTKDKYDIDGDGEYDEVYEISNASEFDWFAGLVNGTHTDVTQNTSANAVLTADIDLSSKTFTSIGAEETNAFSGIFDGNGHKITVNQSGSDNVAIFGYIGTCTIKNLTVTGTINTAVKYAAGIAMKKIGDETTANIENCISDVTIVSSVSGDGTHGGIIGNVDGTVNINNCAFTGKMEGSATTSCGGIIGWTQGSANITNSYVSASFDISSTDGNIVSRKGSNATVTVNNCYYLNALNATQGSITQKTEEQFASGEVAYLLSQGTDGSVWGQKIGTDPNPVLGGEKVYITTPCVSYSNIETKEHTDSDGDGFCDDCGESYDSFGAKPAGYSLSLSGNIAVNFFMELNEEIGNDSGAYMQFTLPNGRTTTVYVPDAKQTEVSGKTYHVFTCEVAAKEMTDTVTAQMFDGSGNCGKEYSYSVKDYADYILNNSDSYSAETVALVNAMLNYGGYSQEHFGYNTDNLANNGIDTTLPDITAETLSDYAAQITANDEVCTFAGAYLTLESETAVNVKVKLAEGVDADSVTVTVNGKSVSLSDCENTDGYYILKVKNISANKLDKMYEFSLTAGENTASLNFGAFSYCHMALSSTSASADLKNLCKSLYAYNLAADAYCPAD